MILRTKIIAALAVVVALIFHMILKPDLNASILAKAKPSEWTSISITPETLLTKNQVADNVSAGSICSGQSQDAKNTTVNPPDVTYINSIALDKYVTDIAWSRDSTLLATSENWASIIKIWSFPQLKLLHKIDLGQSGTERLAFTPDNKYLITSASVPYSTTSRSALSIIDVANGSIIKNVDGPEDPSHFPLANFPANFALSNNGNFLFVSFPVDQNIYVYDTKTWRIKDKFFAGEDAMSAGPADNDIGVIRMQPISPDESINEINGRPNQVLIWDASRRKLVFMGNVFSSDFFTMSMNIPSRKCVFTFGALKVGEHVPVSPQFPNGYSLPSVPKDAVKVWFPLSNKIINIPGKTAIEDVGFDDMFQLVAETEENNTVKLFSLGGINNDEIFEYKIYQFNSYSYRVSFDQSGKFLAVGGDSKVILFKIGA